MAETSGFKSLLEPYTNKSIVERLGVTTTTVTNWRSGRTRPDRQHWAPLAEMLDIDLADFIDLVVCDGGEAMFDSVSQRIRNLKPKPRKAVLAALRAAEAIDQLHED